MSSESGQRLSMEELKRRNAPQPISTQACPSKKEWQELLHRLDELERHTAAHTALLREVSSGKELYPTEEQLETLSRGGGQMCTELKRAGRKKEISILPPGLDTALSVPAWLLLLGTLVGVVALRTIWSGLAAVWSAVRVLIP